MRLNPKCKHFELSTITIRAEPQSAEFRVVNTDPLRLPGIAHWVHGSGDRNHMELPPDLLCRAAHVLRLLQLHMHIFHS